MTTKKKAPKKKPAFDKREFKRWEKQGKALKVSSHQWAIAEWILRGEEHFKPKSKMYDRAVELTGMTRETLQSFASVARNVLARVKGLSFGHHRLVARLKGPDRKKRQEQELNYAKRRRLSVAAFAIHLDKKKGLAREDEQQKTAPTNSDGAAVEFAKRCDELLIHSDEILGGWSLTQLLEGDPPAVERRKEIINKIKGTARKMKEAAAKLKGNMLTLREHWMLYEPLPPGFAWRSKDLYEENQRRVAASKATESAAVAAGSGK